MKKTFELSKRHLRKAKMKAKLFLFATLALLIMGAFAIKDSSFSPLSALSLSALVLVTVMLFLYPKRAKLTVDDDYNVEYCDGYTKHAKFNIKTAKGCAYTEARRFVNVADERYVKYKINFVFDDFGEFIKFFKDCKVPLKCIDAKNDYKSKY